MADSNVYKVIVLLEGGQPSICGAIDHEGAIWLARPPWPVRILA